MAEAIIPGLVEAVILMEEQQHLPTNLAMQNLALVSPKRLAMTRSPEKIIKQNLLIFSP